MRAQIKTYFYKSLSFADQGIVSGSNFIIAIMISHFAGVKTYGEFSLYWLYFFLVQAILTSFIGLPFLVLGNKKKDNERYFKTNLVLLNRLTVLVFILGVIGLVALRSMNFFPINIDLIFSLPLAISLFVMHEQHRRYFLAKHQNNPLLIIDIIAYGGICLTLLVLGVIGQLDLSTIFIAYGFIGLFANIAFHILIKSNFELTSTTGVPFKENWIFSRHLIFTNIIQWSSTNFLLVSLSTLAGTKVVGTVKLIQNLMGVLHIFFATLENIIPPKASFLLHQHSKQHFQHYFKSISFKMGAVILSLLGLLWLFDEEILTFLYGLELKSSTAILQMFTLLYLFIFVGTLLQIYLKTLEINGGILIAYLLSLLFSLTCSNYLISQFSVMGYVYGLMILQVIAISTYLITLKYKKT
ncbi:lipopolysaccharide biosynthesis protein [Crocinitomix algicola]|uniref:lipopolysaccharide biosynthesis protein n=1 Tax=Crocinitomix algicola TaxID=1740263 RepID=UPI000831A83E|nr:hypothetical protein [Crocinitomix algicola]